MMWRSSRGGFISHTCARDFPLFHEGAEPWIAWCWCFRPPPPPMRCGGDALNSPMYGVLAFVGGLCWNLCEGKLVARFPTFCASQLESTGPERSDYFIIIIIIIIGRSWRLTGHE